VITTLLPELSSLVIDEVIDQGDAVRVLARTVSSPVACPGCGEATGRVHAYHRRRLAGLPAGGRGVVVALHGPGVIAHHGCWRDGPARPELPVDARTRARRHAVHDLLAQGCGLLECAPLHLPGQVLGVVGHTHQGSSPQ
jgi:transposase